MAEPTPAERIAQAAQHALTNTMRVEQHVAVPSRERMEGAVLTASLVNGVAQGLSLEGADSPKLSIWLDDDRGAIDLRPVGDDALAELAGVLPGAETGLVQWARGDEKAERAERNLRELFRLRLACDPSLFFRLLAAVADGCEDNPEHPGSIIATMRTWRVLELLDLSTLLIGDIVRAMAIDHGAGPDDPLVSHVISGVDPRIEDQPAVVAAAFNEDGSVQIVQIVVDLGPWYDLVLPDSAEGESFPLVMWQVFETTANVDAAEPFPTDAVDITESLGALTSPEEEIAQLLNDPTLHVESADSAVIDD